MKAQSASTPILARTTRVRGQKFLNGMLVRYTGRSLSAEAARHMAAVKVVRDGIYTVSHTHDDGLTVWLFIQEMPGMRCYADAFVPTPHLAEDHWQLSEVPAYVGD